MTQATDGSGFLKGMMVTLRHFVDTYVDDVRYGFRKYSPKIDNFQERQGTAAAGAYTINYPDEKLAVPERFRFVPFLVVENYDHPDEERQGKDWCTSCGICAKVCPPQCIWIVRSNDPDTGRPVPEPEAFFIDIDICMNCGFCAEFCPFDAIKMDHDYELSDYDRTTSHIFDKEKLSKEFRYWNTIAPTRAIEEAEARGGWEHKDYQKAARRAAKSADTGDDGAATPAASQDARREAVQARKAEAEAEQVTAASTAAAAASGPAADVPTSAQAAAAVQGGEVTDATPWNEEEEKKQQRREAALRRKAARASRDN